jgi:hypothetical protein
MQLYDALVRIGGSPLHEIPKQDLTAAEIICLRAIHGDDAVVQIKARKMGNHSHRGERDRLKGVYGDALVARVFGETYNVQLPVRLEEDEPEAEAEEEPVKRGRQAKGEG